MLCLDCDAELTDVHPDAPGSFCEDCMGLEPKGDAVFALNPEETDYVGMFEVARVTKKEPYVVQITAVWRDDEGDVDPPLLDPVYLTRKAAKKLMGLLRAALKDT